LGHTFAAGIAKDYDQHTWCFLVQFEEWGQRIFGASAASRQIQQDQIDSSSPDTGESGRHVGDAAQLEAIGLVSECSPNRIDPGGVLVDQ
jgi:hypothetical protein